MKKILSFCLLLFAQRLVAQNVNVDSLIRVAIARTSPAYFSAAQNHDSLFRAFTSAKAGSTRTKLIYQLIDNGQPTSRFGLTYFYKILDWAKKNNDPKSEAIISAEIAFQLAQNGDVAQAIKMDLEALKLAEKIGDDEALGIVYDSLGCCYSSSDYTFSSNSKLMIYYFELGLKYSSLAHHDLFISYDYGGLGAAYRVLNMPDSAKYFGFKSFEYAVHKNIPVQIAQSLLDLELLQTTDSLRLKFTRAAIAIATKGHLIDVLGHGYTTLAQIYQLQGHKDSTIFYAKKAYWLATRQSVFGRIGPADILRQVYKDINADSALKYADIFYAARDSVFNIGKLQRAQAISFSEQQRKQEIEAQKLAYAATLRFYFLVVVIAFLIFIAIIFWRNNRINKKGKIQIQSALDLLKATQTQLIQSEKMASLGELTAGIAHEIQNPLNFVNNFSEVNREMIEELKLELKNGNISEALLIADDIEQNEEKITHHGKRADGIVKGMLQHSRASSGTKEPTDLNALADEYLRLAYHGLRAKDKSFNAELITHFDESLPAVNVIPQDTGRVLLNLFTNAFYAVQQKQKTAGPDYRPTVTVTTTVPPLGGQGAGAVLSVADNGTGIPDEIKDKILQPFFTTKPTGEGTGLGLSLSYDIVVKVHGGSIDIQSDEGEGSVFTIQIPNAN